MTRQVLVLRGFGTQQGHVFWRPSPRPAVDAALVDSTPAVVSAVQVGSGGSLQVWLGASQTEGLGTAGPDFTRRMERHGRVEVRAADFTASWTLSDADQAEPYTRFGGEGAAAFVSGVAAATGNRELTLVLDDRRADAAPLAIALALGAPGVIVPARPQALPIGLALSRPAAATTTAALPLAIELALGEPIVADRTRYPRALRESAPADTLLTALEIRHPAVAEPVRVVNDTVGRRIEGHDYAALRFDARLADDVAGQAPQAELAIDNVGRALTQWIEAAHGGIGATVRVMLVLAIDDPPVEWEVTLDVAGMNVDQERVTARLGFDPLLGRAAVTLRHDPQTSPGLF